MLQKRVQPMLVVGETHKIRIRWPISWINSYMAGFRVVSSLEFQQFCFYFLIHYELIEEV